MTKITALPVADQIVGTEHLPIVQGDTTKRVTMAAFRDLITPFLQYWYKGDRGDVGEAANTFDSIARMKELDPVRHPSAILADGVTPPVTYAFVRDDYTGQTDDIDIVALDAVPIAQGALVRQGAHGISFRAGKSAIVETRTSSHDSSKQQLVKRAGREAIHLTFRSIAAALSDMVSVLGGRRVWFLIDEWSEVPVDLQPYLADLFRRVVLPVNEITVKIAAIEHRTNFAILKDRGEYVGLELGADVSADLNLDDFLVFDNSQEKAVDFIGNLIFRHYDTSPDRQHRFTDPNDLIGTIFTQRPVFEEFVRAVEGVPRDALKLIARVVTKAFGQQIAMNHV